MTGDNSARCADICLASGEPLIGTATRVDVWFFVEYVDAWRAKAIDDNELAMVVNEWIASTVGTYAELGIKARPQFIRQARRSDDSVRLMVVADGRTASVDVEDHAALVDIDVRSLDFVEDVEPSYFVCTNGQRDACCSLYGMPLYRKLFSLVGERAWQTSHVGGHRYAPNVLVTPSAELFGRVFEDDAEAFVSAIEAGASPTRFLRGRSTLEGPAQVAVAAFGGDSRVELVDGDVVTVTTPDGEERVIVRESAESFEVVPSCGKPAEIVRPLTVERRVGA